MEIILSIIGGILIILLGVIGFFIKRYFNARDKKEDTLTEVANALQNTVDKLDKTVAKLGANVLAQVEICKLKHVPIDKRLDKHSSEIDANLRAIHRLETKVAKINGK